MAISISLRDWYILPASFLDSLSDHVSCGDISTRRDGLMGSCSSTFQYLVLRIILA